METDLSRRICRLHNQVYLKTSENVYICIHGVHIKICYLPASIISILTYCQHGFFREGGRE